MQTTHKNPRTTSKEVKTAIQNYILGAIDTEDYPEVSNTIPAQLEFICSEFKRVAGYKNNLSFHKTYQQCFIDWFQGMPSYFDISVYNYDIIHELMPSFGLPLPSNKTESEGIELFNYLIYREFIALCKKNKVDFYSFLNWN